jgi:DNA-binding protein H-NS
MQFDVIAPDLSEDLVRARILIVAAAALTALMPIPSQLRAQDVPGIEICTAEKTMPRRTSCLQSNVDFLQKMIIKLTADHQQKLDAANRQIDGLKAAMVTLQKTVEDLQAAQRTAADESKKKTEAPPAKDAAAATPAKDGAK